MIDSILQKNSQILKCYAVSSEDRSRPISYKLSNSAGNFNRNNKQIFREFVEKSDTGTFSYVVVRNMESLDFEQVQNYTLVLTATVINTLLHFDFPIHVFLLSGYDFFGHLGTPISGFLF